MLFAEDEYLCLLESRSSDSMNIIMREDFMVMGGGEEQNRLKRAGAG